MAQNIDITRTGKYVRIACEYSLEFCVPVEPVWVIIVYRCIIDVNILTHARTQAQLVDYWSVRMSNTVQILQTRTAPNLYGLRLEFVCQAAVR